MAQASLHARNDSGVSVNSFMYDHPPSPTLTNPDMIMPVPPWQDDSDFDGPHPLLEPEHALSQTLSNTSFSTDQRHSGLSPTEVGIATAVRMPFRTSQPASITAFSPYEHGVALSDIYEESEATATPTKSTIRSYSARTTPNQAVEELRSPTRPISRHMRRNSSLSASSGGSDVDDWEAFDSSKILSSRVAADLAQMRRDDTFDVEEASSKRQSREEEELAALNARAERILEDARKRLTHMGDNLRTARNSSLLPARSSPHLGDYQQPVGGLYRSISAAGASKLGKRPLYPQIRTSASVQHLRGDSDASASTTSKRYSRLPDARPASAMEYGPAARYSLFPDTTHSPSARMQPSPINNRGNKLLLPSLGEERGSPSSDEDTPEDTKKFAPHGLGIHTSAAISRENLALTLGRSASSRPTPTPTQHGRTSSATSIKSAQDLKDQMMDLKSRIADLKLKAQTEKLKRRSIQSLRSSSPFTPGPPEQYYASSPAYNEEPSPVNANAGVGWRTSPVELRSDSRLATVGGQRELESLPITPANARFLNVEHMTPGTETNLMSSARTDRNDPMLVQGKQDTAALEAEEYNEDEDDVASVIEALPRQHIPDELDYADKDNETEEVAENEEEQIYLNEVLEQSLREAEVEPEIPTFPGSFLPSPDGVPAVMAPEPERHEDRIDAFDYENMFLHSAMGTYTGKGLSGSDSGSDSESEGDGSVETSRADMKTPVDDTAHSAQEEPVSDDEIVVVTRDIGPESDFQSESTPRPDQATFPRQLRSPPQIPLPQPPKPWAHVRNYSADSVSTAATFETAMEGEDEDELNPILHWDPAPSSGLGFSRYTNQGYGQPSSNVRGRHGFSSPRNGGRSPVVSKTLQAPLRMAYDHTDTDRAQYINDNGVPERFQGRPSPQRSEQSSVPPQPVYRSGSVATAKSISPIRAAIHGRQYSASQIRSPFVSSSTTMTPQPFNSSSPSGSSTIVTVSSPQRKVVINRSLQHPQSFILEPQTYSPPNLPLPDPPPPTAASSAALQAQIASPKQITIKPPSRRPSSTQKRTPPLPPTQLPPTTPPTPVSNTEILMESLIKLADPTFTLAPGTSFANVDTDLVLGLLRAVGSVVDGVLRAEAGHTVTGKEETDRVVQILRRRVEVATGILEGGEEKWDERRVR